MARISRLRRAYLKQRRTAIAEIRLKDMVREAHRRANQGISFDEAHKRGLSPAVCNSVEDIYGWSPLDTTNSFNNFKRKMLRLGECSETTSREEIVARLNRVRDFAECIFLIADKALYLIRDTDGFYFFLYREKGSYYKKSIYYKNRTISMERYEQEKITWIAFFDETASD